MGRKNQQSEDGKMGSTAFDLLEKSCSPFANLSMAIIWHYEQDSRKVPLEAPPSLVKQGKVLHLQLGLEVSLSILAPGAAEDEGCLKNKCLLVAPFPQTRVSPALELTEGLCDLFVSWTNRESKCSGAKSQAFCWALAEGGCDKH